MQTITINARTESGAPKETFRVNVPASVKEGIEMYGEAVVLGMIDGAISSSAKVQWQKVYRDARNNKKSEKAAGGLVLNHKPIVPTSDRGKSEVQKLASRARRLKTQAEKEAFLLDAMCINFGISREEAEKRAAQMRKAA